MSCRFLSLIGSSCVMPLDLVFGGHMLVANRAHTLLLVIMSERRTALTFSVLT